MSGPVTGGNGSPVALTTDFDLGQVGYARSEFFVSGTARSYLPTQPLDSDGQWQVTPADSAPYTTRVVVHQPTDPRRFNGTVVVEWLNVTGGFDVAPEWRYTHEELIREGYAWVGVSVQQVGVSATRASDPVRYAPLSHPGDSFSYDIFSQAGQALRDSGRTIFGDLKPRTFLGEGESQSAFRMTTYINAVAPLAHVYDGYLVHSRGAFATPLSQAPQQPVDTPQIVRIRQDLTTPVLTVQAETDVLLFGFWAARQNDSSKFRLWEIAGTAHGDPYLGSLTEQDVGNVTTDIEQFNSMLNPPSTIAGGAPSCGVPVNTGQHNYVLNSAQYWLNRWVTRGEAPPSAPRLQITPGAQPDLVRDADGIAKGGVRTPAVDVPVATLSGFDSTGQSTCILYGTTIPFSAEKLASRYPSHDQFVAHWSAATLADTAAGFIRPADAFELVIAAGVSQVGSSSAA